MLDRRTFLAVIAAIPLAACVTGASRRHAAPARRDVQHLARHERLASAAAVAGRRAARGRRRCHRAPGSARGCRQGLAQPGGHAGPRAWRLFGAFHLDRSGRRAAALWQCHPDPLAGIAEASRKLEPLDDYRTALRVRVRAFGQPVDVVNTHLAWQEDAGPVRMRQVADLLSWLPAPGVPLIVMGDFNAPLTDAGLALLTAPRFATALPLGAAATTLNPAKGHPPRVIDHIFVERTGFTIERRADHRRPAGERHSSVRPFRRGRDARPALTPGRAYPLNSGMWPSSIGSLNLVTRASKRMRTLPVAPWRCLATISSAMP